MNDPERLRPLFAGQPVVLVAEDDAMVCNVVRIALERLGMFVLTACNGGQALELSRKFPGTIHALVSDIAMLNLDGFALREQILRERPATKVLLMSGSVCPPDGVPFLPKPFVWEEFRQKVRQLVAEALLTPPA